jgi:hypothetical protein
MKYLSPDTWCTPVFPQSILPFSTDNECKTGMLASSVEENRFVELSNGHSQNTASEVFRSFHSHLDARHILPNRQSLVS